jgi:hypothetical protein
MRERDAVCDLASLAKIVIRIAINIVIDSQDQRADVIVVSVLGAVVASKHHLGDCCLSTVIPCGRRRREEGGRETTPRGAERDGIKKNTKE